MPTKRKPRFSFMGRPRGRKYQNISISLELKQVAYLDTQPNPSKLIRRLLSEHMKQLTTPEETDSLDSLRIKLEQAEKTYAELKGEFSVWKDDHETELYEDLETKEWAGRPWFKEKKTSRTDKLIEIYYEYERNLKELDDTVKKLREAVAEAEKVKIT